MMQLATTYFYEQLSSEFPDVDFHVNEIPEVEETRPPLPVGRIVEIGMNYDNFASNYPLSTASTVQIDLWFESLREAEEYYYSLDAFLLNDDVYCIYSEINRDYDFPDTIRIIKRYILDREIILN